uniref:Probable nitronate monooxygenase n=1 Tax=Eubacterium cellulosolvens (strain ATCC 43171 / JCM 9499 / 6) TaxID=633697 RepID=I5AXG3_EUBC6
MKAIKDYCRGLLEIRDRVMSVPLIQGGMGVGVSLGRLAGSIARKGGVGCISTADCGYLEEDFDTHPEEANLRALHREIQKAREISEDKGLIAINAMVATQQYDDAVKTAVDDGIDAVISGAGLPTTLPSLVPEGSALIAPIVSGGRAAGLILKVWETKYHRYPDFVVVEGPKAGGHLGFTSETLGDREKTPDILDLIKEVSEVIRPYEDKAGHAIPLYAAGGFWDREDIEEAMEAGADGVQMATRFIGTYECDATQGYKDVLIHGTSRDLSIIKSPVGMPGRALMTPLLQRVKKEGRVAPLHCSRCIKTCNIAKVPYCITNALIEAVKGNYEEGLFFSGANIDRLTKMCHVGEIIDELFSEMPFKIPALARH